MMRRKVLAMKAAIRLAVVAILVSLGFSQTPKAQDSRTCDDVREAVLRYQISSWELAAATYCVSVDGKDADENFLRRFRPLPVKAASRCKKQRPPKLPKIMNSVVDKQTKKKSVIFDIGEARWVKPSEAEVDGGHDCASQCMAGGTYHVVWDGTRWNITAFDIRVQS